MDKNVEILSNIISFLVVAIIFLTAIVIIFALTLKKYNVKSNKLKFYGLFLEMDNPSIIAFSAISLNYIFLIWCTTTFSSLNYIYVLMTFAFVLVADFSIKKFKEIPRDMLFCLINCLCIYVVSLIYNYLVNEYTSIFLLIILGLLMLFVFLYYTYITFKLLNEIATRNKLLKNKKYDKI